MVAAGVEPPPPGVEDSFVPADTAVAMGSGQGTVLPTGPAAKLLADLNSTLTQFAQTFATLIGIAPAAVPAPISLTPPLPPRSLAADLNAAAETAVTTGGNDGAAGGSDGRVATGSRELAAGAAPQPAADLNGAASPPVGGNVPVAADGERNGDSAPRGVKVSIASPELNLDGLKSQQQILRARAFIRDLKRYFSVAEWGDSDAARCLYIASALKGAAKTWYDDWSLSVGEEFTSERLLKALGDRFAPAVLTLSEEARNKLAARRYMMRDKEAVSAYLTRFNALVAPIHDMTPTERVFWFRSGLPEWLATKCARDPNGKPFTSFDALVDHALSAESKKAAGAFAAASSLRLNFTQATDDAGMETEDEDNRPTPAPKRQKRADGSGPSAAVTEIADGSLPCPPRTSDETKFGVSEAILKARKVDGLCFVCGKPGHSVKAHVGYDNWQTVVRKGGQGGRGRGRGGGQGGGRGNKGGRGGAAGKAGGRK